jgi:rod shape determining protein RodA
MIRARFLRQLQQFDWILLLATFVLFAFGLSAIYSVELSRGGSEFLFVRKHLIAFGIGFAMMLVAANSNYLLLRSYGRVLYIAGVVMMIGVLLFGTELNGTTGWFIFFGLSFQPVEYMKLALAVQLARYFGEHARRRFGWREIIGSGLLTAIPTGLTMLQPDLGSAVLLVGMWLIVMFFAGLRTQHIITLLISGLIVGVFAWGFFLQDYQRERLRVFLNPALDPLESGYNITQAKIAIGSGEIFGRGLGFGSQSQLKFLPESQTDFIFAVIAEELGFLGVLMVLSAFVLLLWRMISIAFHARDNFTSFLSIAIFAIIFVQMTVNVGVNLAMLPTTGVALPLVSYGGTSLLMTLVMIGILESIAARTRPGDRLERMV